MDQMLEKGETLSRTVFEQHFHRPQKNGGNRPVINLKHLNSFIFSTFRNCRSTFSKRTAFAKRLDGQSWFERCIFLNTHPSEFTEILTLRMGIFKNNWENIFRGKQTPPVSIVLDYLAELFDQGYGYNYIASHWSAISAYHEPVEGISVGKHPRVSTLLTGIFNKKPPLPRYKFGMLK